MFKNVTKQEIVIPAQMIYLREVREFIEQIGKRYKFSDKIINSFKLVVDEACTNIIRHGYRDIKNGQITVRAIIRRLSLTIVIIDRGKSFDPRQVKNPDLGKYVQIGKKGGLGIFMMRKLMDDIKYNVTGHGNELRLTKIRESEESPKWIFMWESLTLKAKFSLAVSAIITLIALVIFFISMSNAHNNIREDIFSKSEVIVKNLAEVAWNPLIKDENIALFQVAKSAKESDSELVEYAIITNDSFQVLAMYPVIREMAIENKPVPLHEFSKIDSMNSVVIYKQELQDSILYYFSTPINLQGEVESIGYAYILINQETILQEVNRARRNLVIYLVLFLAVAFAGVYFLIAVIMEPFHKLADWVRQVGRGHMDEDEIDIDARDELGEIAQAFSEMTSKFREAQVNLVEQQRLQKELQVAQEIQQMLLPDDFPNVLGYDISSYYHAAKEVGGDLFDFVEVDENSLGICVADVSGKGVPGSLVMTMIRTSLRLEARGNKNPAEVLSKVNSFVTEDMRKGMFVTVFYVLVDSRERIISFSSAGHNPMILYRGKSKETFYLNPSGFPVGITLPDINLFSQKIQMDRLRLHPDDILVLYTDGITEAMNPKRELYGEERFLAAIRKFGHLDVVEFVTSLKDDILSFTGGYEQNDDITLVAIKENMAAVDVKVNTFKEMFERIKSDEVDQTIVNICKEYGISTSTYYRYKKIYEEGGWEHLREMLHGFTNIALKHLSIEVKTKMYDIIREHPEWGAKRISDELNTEKYGFTHVQPHLIYEELKRAKLNTRQRREMFVQRGGTRRLKPPGTPLLTLDGEVTIGYRSEDQSEMPFNFIAQNRGDSKSKEKMISVKGRRLDKKDDLSDGFENRKKDTPREEDTVVSKNNDENKEKVDENLDENIEEKNKNS